MHGISSAFPSHVKIEHVCYDVVCWTTDGPYTPIPWIIRDGALTSLEQLPFLLYPKLAYGTAAEAEARG